MLGATHVDGRPFFVRQMKNMKASIPVEYLTAEAFYFYAEACGALLSRAHARVGDAAAINGYCGGSTVLDEALASWAEAYGDQTERDHAQLVKAIKSGTVKAIEECDRSFTNVCEPATEALLRVEGFGSLTSCLQRSG